MWTEDSNCILTVLKMYPYLNLKRYLIPSLIFTECSLYLKENVWCSLEFASYRFKGVLLPKFTKFSHSFSYVYIMQFIL